MIVIIMKQVKMSSHNFNKFFLFEIKKNTININSSHFGKQT